MIDLRPIPPGWVACLLISLGVACCEEHVIAGDIICCGGDEVFVVDPLKPSVKKWSWRAGDSPSIPDDFRAKFRATDDCKPYQGDTILITSSGGGVSLINRTTKKCLFLADARNAHSACLLPRNRVAVASSYGGDEMQFYDLADGRKPAVPLQTIRLNGAHGTVWDNERKCLWALGGDELLRLVIKEQAVRGMQWSIGSRHSLPSPGGHDLSPMHNGTQLFVTSNTQVLLFNCDENTFERHTEFGDQLRIKSVDIHPVTRAIVFHKASTEHWSSDMARFVGRDPQKLDGERLYKIRWDVPARKP